MTETKIRGYCFKYGFIWIGWFVKTSESLSPIYYYDNSTSTTLSFETKIEYMAFGFTERTVLNKLKRYLDKKEALKKAISEALNAKPMCDQCMHYTNHTVDSPCITCVGMNKFKKEKENE